jgi:type II secretory pathway pseudopilin PulG
VVIRTNKIEMFYLIRINNILLYFFTVLFFLLITSPSDYGFYDKVSKKYKLVLQQMLYISIAIEKFSKDIQRYPTVPEGLTILVKNTTNQSNWNGPYIKAEILDSFLGGDITKDPWGNEFIYLYPPKYLFNNNPYNLYSKGTNQVDDYTKKDDISNWREGNIELYEETDFVIETFDFFTMYSPFFLLLLVLLKFFLRNKST